MASSSGEITQSPGQIDEGGKVTIDGMFIFVDTR